MSTECVTPLDRGVFDIKEKCPAFKEKCPFDAAHGADLKNKAKSCPAFKDGCTFTETKSMKDVYNKLVEMPNYRENGTPHHQVLIDVMKLIHSVSTELKDSLGGCPVFTTAQGCPFKTVCSDGELLVKRLSDYSTDAVVPESISDAKRELENQVLTGKTDDPSVIVRKQSSDTKIVHQKTVLSQDLSTGTKKIHRQAERCHFLKEFMRCRVKQTIYREYVASLYFIYCALEEESVRHAHHPLFSKVHFPDQLNRKQALEHDLHYFYGDAWHDDVRISEATERYVSRIRQISTEDPTRLIAHHYTRYLGDLSGGQILGKVATKAYDLPENGDGARFYTFENVANSTDFKNKYRENLDNMNMTREEADKLVEEAKVAFKLNIELFRELDRLAGFEEEIFAEEVDLVEDTPIVAEKQQAPTEVFELEWFHWLAIILAIAAALVAPFLS